MRRKGEGESASVPTDLCVVCVTRPHNASFIHGDTGHQVCCFECTSRLKYNLYKHNLSQFALFNLLP